MTYFWYPVELGSYISVIWYSSCLCPFMCINRLVKSGLKKKDWSNLFKLAELLLIFVLTIQVGEEMVVVAGYLLVRELQKTHLTWFLGLLLLVMD